MTTGAIPIDPLRLEQRHYRGAASETIASYWFLRQGYQVYQPVIQQSCVDFVVYKDGEYQAVQVKTASWSRTGNHQYLQCRTASTNKYAEGEYDLLAVVKEPFIWLIPKQEIESTNLSLMRSSGTPTPWDGHRFNLMEIE